MPYMECNFLMAQKGEDLRQPGYRCTFVEPPPAGYVQSKCPICDGILREPYLTNCCGTSFCRACIDTIQKDLKPCPISTCQNSAFTTMHDKRLEKILGELTVSCENHASGSGGCEWKGVLGKMDAHLREECKFVTVSCKHSGCFFRELRRDISAHEEVCGHRPFRCEHCKEYESIFDNADEHWRACLKYPVQCPNKCSDTMSIERQLLQAHLDNDCPLTRIDCEFSYAGCNSKLSRKDLEDHSSKAVVFHLSLMAKINKQLLEQNCKLLERLSRLETQSAEKIETEMVEQAQEFGLKLELGTRKVRGAEAAMVNLKLLEEKLSEQMIKQETACKQQKEWYEAQTAELRTRLEADLAEQKKELVFEQTKQLDKKMDECKMEMEKRAEYHGSSQSSVTTKSISALISLLFKELKLPVPPLKIEFQHKISKVQTKTLLQERTFYSHFGGFKLHLQIYVEDVNNKGDFFSKYYIIVHVMRGEFDDCLQWPFEATLILGVKTDAEVQEHLINFKEAPEECKSKVHAEKLENKGWGPVNPVLISAARHPAPSLEFTIRNVNL